MIRSATSAVLAHIVMPWKMPLRWDVMILRQHLRYNVTLQTGQFVGMLEDSISPLVIGILLRAADVGYVTWASALAAYSVWVLLPMQRFYLPLFARLQHDPPRLWKVVEYVVVCQCFCCSSYAGHHGAVASHHVSYLRSKVAPAVAVVLSVLRRQFIHVRGPDAWFIERSMRVSKSALHVAHMYGSYMNPWCTFDFVVGNHLDLAPQ